MTSTTDSQLTDASSLMLCAYANSTSDLQFVRIVNVPNGYFDKLLFPKQRLLFKTPPNTELEVYASYQGQTVLVNKLPSVCLQVR